MRSYAPKISSVLHHVQQLESQPYPIVALGREYPNGHLVERHHHERTQLIYASRGIMRVDTPKGIWVVPPMRAIWMPPGIEHEIRASSTVFLRSLFIQPALRESLPSECCVIDVSPLLRELILRMVNLSESGATHVPRHMVDVILDEIRAISVLPLHIPMPRDPRVLRVCHEILENPGDVRTCATWGASTGASARTLERLFQKETGLSFGAWRRQVRLLAALNRLAAEVPIATVALDLGYDSPSAFTAMFKRVLGRPPTEFFPASGFERHG